jgi:hypothetical protein
MNTLWLIHEGQNDVEVAKAILKHHAPHIKVVPILPTGNNPNLARLSRQIKILIEGAIQKRQKGDCIVVLHDADKLTRPHNRQDYEHIQQVCISHRRDVYLVIAHDEIEAWLLADEGFCRWLGTKPRNWDEQAKPSVTLINLLDKAGKSRYALENLPKLLIYVDGTGAKYSPSLKEALDHLKTAPCNLDIES